LNVTDFPEKAKVRACRKRTAGNTIRITHVLFIPYPSVHNFALSKEIVHTAYVPFTPTKHNREIYFLDA
jgi:hypothetical protein